MIFKREREKILMRKSLRSILFKSLSFVWSQQKVIDFQVEVPFLLNLID